MGTDLRGRPARGASHKRLLPTLLDRLIDVDPNQRHEALDVKAMGQAEYRRTVLRDLHWLLNASAPGTSLELDGLDEVQRSVVNFGLPPFAGQRLSELDWPAVVEAVRLAIERYEPRINAASLEVRPLAQSDGSGHHNLVGLEIRGQLWAQPFPLELLLHSHIDLESGSVRVVDQLGRGT